jgi:hypothetical protein
VDKKVVVVTGLYVGPVRVNMYGNVPPVETATFKIPLLLPQVVPVVDAVTVNKLTEVILVVAV